MQKLITFAVLLFCLLSPSSVLAVEIKIDEFPSQVGSEEFVVKTSVIFSGTTNANNFLRLDLYKNDTNDYFGETWNGSSWYSGSEGTNYFPIEIKEGSGSAEIKARLPAVLPSSYTGPGPYKLRVRRYTASGNAASGDTYAPVDIQISLATPTPTPSPTPTPHQTTPTPTPKPTPSPPPSPVPKSTPLPQMAKTPEPVEKLESSSSGKVMGISSFSAAKSASASNESEDETQTENKPKTYPLFLAGSGLCFLAIAAPKLKVLLASLVSDHFSG